MGQAPPTPEWKGKRPACLNCTPAGFEPWTANLVLIPANGDYVVADAMVVPLYRLGVNTPNKITGLNCVVRALLCVAFLAGHRYGLVTALLLVTQWLDCADGQCARRFRLGSEFGAWLDHTTDSIFGLCFALSALYLVGGHNGVGSPATLFLVGFFVVLGAVGRGAIDAKEANRHWKDYGLLARLGVYQELYMCVLALWAMFCYCRACS